MSIAGGLHQALLHGQSIGCETIQIFTRNSNRWQSARRTPEELERFRQTQAETGIHPVVAHAIYLINLASPDQEIRRKSDAAFREELARCHEAGIPYLVLHPGSHRETGIVQGIAHIAASINRAYADHPAYVPPARGSVVTLLENTAGQGATIGRTFEELAEIAAQIEDPACIGYCFDTAHGLASGYDLRTPEGYAETFARFDRVLGLDRLRCIHLNDSQYDLGAGRDRHAHIGQGHVGLEAFRMLLNDPRFADLPMLLETPRRVTDSHGEDMREDVENLAILRSLIVG
jgi:deoxyribonuclease-4